MSFLWNTQGRSCPAACFRRKENVLSGMWKISSSVFNKPYRMLCHRFLVFRFWVDFCFRPEVCLLYHQESVCFPFPSKEKVYSGSVKAVVYSSSPFDELKGINRFGWAAGVWWFHLVPGSLKEKKVGAKNSCRRLNVTGFYGGEETLPGTQFTGQCWSRDGGRQGRRRRGRKIWGRKKTEVKSRRTQRE